MLDQRRHQRIRFSVPQKISIGYGGEIGEGVIENLSLSGLMMRTPMPLEISRNVGCEFSVFDSPLIDVPAAVVSRVCDLFGVRFPAGADQPDPYRRRVQRRAGQRQGAPSCRCMSWAVARPCASPAACAASCAATSCMP